ncbi:hypothetical protein CWC38_07330 [Kocuria tytonicola]|nr:hypothetical protein CWC38_07330 [Kocuria tytonicola]
MVGALLALLVLWGLVPLIAHAGLGTVTGQALDEAALTQAKADRTTLVPTPVLVAAQYLPEVVAVLAGVLALVWAVRHRRWSAALFAVGSVLAANLTTQFLKHGVLDKPDLGVQQIASNSFPSGHTTAAASLLMAALLVAPAHRRARTGRWGAFLAALVGMSTVLNGWHRPTDAVAALLIVAGWGVLATLLTRLLDAALGRSGLRTGSAPGQAYRRFREDRSRKRQELSWSEDRGESAYMPPAHERAEQERARAASSSAGGAPVWNGNPPWNGDPAGNGNPGWAPQPYGYAPRAPRVPARPRIATAVLLTVLTTALVLLAVWWPYPTVAGTFAGRVTLTAGYLGIASAAALGWAVVARRLRPATR